MRRPRVALVTVKPGSDEVGGAERFSEGLDIALEKIGMDVDVVSRVSHEQSFADIKRSYLRFYDLDLSKYDGVLSAKSPSYAVRHGNHVCYLMHTMRVFYDMFDKEFPNPSEELINQRKFINLLDTSMLGHPRIKKLFTIGEEVSSRLKLSNGIDSSALRHPTNLGGLKEGRFEYMFLPGRLHRWKRVDLAIDAMRYVHRDVKLLIAGVGEDAERFARQAVSDDRILFLGRVSEDRLVDLYANALGVIFVPKSEDLGLVTFEAFQSAKPVITCSDSGEPSRIVVDGLSGFVSSPEPHCVARCIEALVDNPSRAMTMGLAGKKAIQDVSWEGVARTLADGLGFHNIGKDLGG